MLSRVTRDDQIQGRLKILALEQIALAKMGGISWSDSNDMAIPERKRVTDILREMQKKEVDTQKQAMSPAKGSGARLKFGR